jgi:hypothetical protein
LKAAAAELAAVTMRVVLAVAVVVELVAAPLDLAALAALVAIEHDAVVAVQTRAPTAFAATRQHGSGAFGWFA